MKKTKIIALIVFVAVSIALILFNIYTSRVAWSLPIICIGLALWRLIYKESFFENIFSIKLLRFIIQISFFIIILALILHNFQNVVAFSLFACCFLQIIAVLLYLKEYQKGMVMSPLYMIECLIISISCLIIGLIIKSSSITVLSISAITFFIPTFIFMQEEIRIEIKKRLHMI